ncbi:hypothetical protein VNI00_016943 [Paramarasmius palmivorus]|uniref:Uncharacterized protein n=1 Tax=Paramarasmius palmivorus TaxID=297713 RepID=A0AAW0BBB4_9AGAR
MSTQPKDAPVKPDDSTLPEEQVLRHWNDQKSQRYLAQSPGMRMSPQEYRHFLHQYLSTYDSRNVQGNQDSSEDAETDTGATADETSGTTPPTSDVDLSSESEHENDNSRNDYRGYPRHYESLSVPVSSSLDVLGVHREEAFATLLASSRARESKRPSMADRLADRMSMLKKKHNIPETPPTESEEEEEARGTEPSNDS